MAVAAELLRAVSFVYLCALFVAAPLAAARSRRAPPGGRPPGARAHQLVPPGAAPGRGTGRTRRAGRCAPYVGGGARGAAGTKGARRV